MSEDAWLHRAAPDEDTQPQRLSNGVAPIPETGEDAAPGATVPATPGASSESSARPDGESSDLLRWRAEMLMDEMMVGAVDASAGDQGGGFRPLAPADLRPAASPWEPPAREEPAPAPARPTRAPRPIVPGASAPVEPARTPAVSPAAYANGRNGSGHGSANGTPGYTPASYGAAGHGAAGHGAAGHGAAGHGAAGHGAAGHGAAGHGAAAYGGEQSSQPSAPDGDTSPGPAPMPPYQPAAVSRISPQSHAPAAPREQASSAPRRLNGYADAYADTYAPDSPPRSAGRPAQSGERHPYDDEPPRKLTAVEQRYPRSGARRAEPITPVVSNGRHAEESFPDDPFTPGLGPIRRNPAVIRHDPAAGAMAVENFGSRYTSKYAHLLPRSTPWDEHEMEREIASLADEMARVLPSGHESSRRARHLLEKAQTIFASDPLRSAEVDYYLSQVRAIVQRSRQTVQWSGHYRKQLVLYQTAWLLFSGMLVAACVLYGDAIAATLGAWFGWAEGGFLARSFAAGVIALFSGSFGGALGGLLNLQRYHRLELGYVDRKYSLRGLILPLMGLLIGLALFGLVAGVGALVGMAGAWPLWLELTPALLAFLFGLLQESIYGTRE